MSYPSGEFAVIVSEFDRVTGKLDEKSVLEHARVVSQSFRTATVLPFRFGTIFDTEDAIRQAVRANRRTFCESVARLRGKVHQVYTAVAVFDPTSGRLVHDLCTSLVRMRRYRPDEVGAYVASGDPLDKAGAYAIQHPVFQPVEHFAGCFASVMGLPLCHVTRTFQKFGLPPIRDVPQACQDHLNYQCPIHQAVLRGEDVG